jgi:hypothetical protein
MAKDLCIMCGKETAYEFETHIDMRYGYVEGAGQCCKDCYDGPSKSKEEDYITRTMRNRTTLITISGEEILDTPNDMELGGIIRNRFYEARNIR